MNWITAVLAVVILLLLAGIALLVYFGFIHEKKPKKTYTPLRKVE